MRAILVTTQNASYWADRLPTADESQVGDMCFDYGDVDEEGFGGHVGNAPKAKGKKR